MTAILQQQTSFCIYITPIKREFTKSKGIKTDITGKYTFYTLKPGTYPDGSLPAHIHGTILESSGDYYWIDEWHFIGDPLFKIEYESEDSVQGGSGIVELKQEGDLLVAYRDIILGKNVPVY
jgi:protocatechuate 3,4-dioxygenase beta subunit